MIHKLRECVTKPDEQDALLADYLVRDILNTAAALMVEELLKLTGMAKGLKDFGAPDEVVNHKAIRMHEPELVLKQLERFQG